LIKGQEEFEFTIHFLDTGTRRASKAAILDKLTTVINKGDPDFTLLLEYGVQGWTFNPQGVLCEITTKLSVLKVLADPPK
jgi:hypothetical protein